MTDDLTVLSEADHYLDWLGTDPAQAVRDEIERVLRRQVPTTEIKWIHLHGKPEFLTGGRPVSNDPDKIIMTRAACAVSFRMQVSSDDGTEVLSGVFSWVAAGLDAERADRVYLDLNTEISEASILLKGRIYELDAAPAKPLSAAPAKQKRWWNLWSKLG